MSAPEPFPLSDLPVKVSPKRPKKSRWNKHATHIIKLEMLKQEIGYKELARLIAKLEPDEEEYRGETLATRVNRGTFTFALALLILRVLKVETLSIAHLPSAAQGKSK